MIFSPPSIPPSPAFPYAPALIKRPFNVIGIDPGINGAIAEIHFLPPNINTKDNKERSIMAGRIYDIPRKKRAKGNKIKDEVDIKALFEIIPKLPDDVQNFIFCEDVGAMHTGSRSGYFQFGETCGRIQAVAECKNLGHEIIYIPPLEWKRALGLIRGRTSKAFKKSEAIKKARELFPEAEEQLRLAKHDGRAEALLIGYYGGKRLEQWKR